MNGCMRKRYTRYRLTKRPCFEYIAAQKEGLYYPYQQKYSMCTNYDNLPKNVTILKLS